jgi:dihydroflavonol-4-reductase
MKVLVTGGSGFIGSRLAAALAARGDSVRVLRRARSQLIALEGLPVEHCIGDVLDPDSIARAIEGCDLVFHLAAISSYWREPQDKVYRVNVEGTRNVMQAALRAGTPRVVHTSSVAAIGLPAKGAPGDEETPFDDFSAAWTYGNSKHQAEEAVQQAVAQGLSAVIVNPAVVIGAGDHNQISGSIVVQMARRNLPAVPPGGVCVADADAVVAGCLTAAERGRPGQRYILGGENLSYREMAAVIAGVVGRPAPKRVIPRQVLAGAATAVDAYNRISRRTPVLNGDHIRLSGRRLFYVSDKAVRELDYALLPFAGAVEKAYKWYRDHGFLT